MKYTRQVHIIFYLATKEDIGIVQDKRNIGTLTQPKIHYYVMP